METESTIMYSVGLFFFGFIGYCLGYRRGAEVSANLAIGKPISVYNLPKYTQFTLVDTMAGNRGMVMLKSKNFPEPFLVDMDCLEIPNRNEPFYLAYDDRDCVFAVRGAEMPMGN